MLAVYFKKRVGLLWIMIMNFIFNFFLYVYYFRIDMSIKILEKT